MKLTTRLKGYIDEAMLTNFSQLASLSITSENSLRVTLNRLVAKGEIYNPLKGTYVSKQADMFWVACQLYQGYISLSTAFYLHHLIEEFQFTIFVGADIRKSVRMGNMEFVYFRAKDYLGVEKATYPIASVEKAVCDAICHGNMTSYPMLTKVLANSNIKSQRMITLASKENAAFFQRLGYLLSILPDLDAEKAKLLRFCRKKVKANAYLQGRSHGVYVPEWKIVDNVGKEVLLAWWQQ